MTVTELIQNLVEYHNKFYDGQKLQVVAIGNDGDGQKLQVVVSGNDGDDDLHFDITDVELDGGEVVLNITAPLGELLGQS